MKESGKENLKPTIYDKTLSTAGAVPLPHAGKAYMEAASPRSFGSGRSCSGIRYLTYDVSCRSG